MQWKRNSGRWAARFPRRSSFPTRTAPAASWSDRSSSCRGHGRDLPSLPNVKHAGKVGRDLTVEEGYATARAVGLSILASLKQQLGDLDRIKRVVRLFGMVNAAPGFDQMPQVIDGASDFFYELFGPENGQHARSAVGLAELPHGIPVEINGEFELRS